MDDKTHELMELLAAKLGTKAGELGEHAVNYVLISAWTCIIGGALLLIISIILAYGSYRNCRKYIERDGSSYGSNEEISAVLFGVGAFLSFVFGIAAIMDNLARVIEPVGATIRGML